MLSAHQRDRPDYGRTARHRVLPYVGFVILLVVAFAGWALSYNKLHHYGLDVLGFGPQLAWLVPVVFDGAPVGLSIVVYRARLQARSALVWRLGIWAFCGLSSWINWMTLDGRGASVEAQVIAALLPIAAVVLFEGMMHETHRAAQADLWGGQVVPKLTLGCWILDRKRTFRAFKTKTLRPLAAAETALGITSEATPGPLPDGVAGLPLADGEHPLTTPGRKGDHPPVSTPGNEFDHPPVHGGDQTGREQARQEPVSTLVTTPAHEPVTTPDHTGGQLVPYDPLTLGPDSRRDQGACTRWRVSVAHTADPEASHRALADRLGVSVPTVRRYRPKVVNGSH